MPLDKDSHSNLLSRVISAFRWVVVLQLSGQVLSWASTIFVIRFLAPEDFGVMSLAEVFRSLLVLFSTMGLSQGLIKRESLEPELIQKTLGLLFIVNILLFLVQYVSAPHIADFYDSEDLELVMKVLAFSYLFVPWVAVPYSLIVRNLDHKKSSKVEFFVSLLSSLLSLSLAYLGYGYWALVFAILLGTVFRFVLYNIIVDYAKVPLFDFSGTAEFFKFGAFIAVTNLLWVAHNKVDMAIAGVYFEIGDVGVYGVAIHLATLLMTKSMPIFNHIALPAFSRMNDISGDSNQYLITALRLISLLVFPIFFGAAIIASDVIELFLGEEWARVSAIFCLIVVTVPFRILSYVITPAVLASGAANINMGNAFATLIFSACAVLGLVSFGLPGLAVAWSMTSIVIFLLAILRGARVLHISLVAVAGAIAPAFFGASMMYFLLSYINWHSAENTTLMVPLNILLGIAVYVGYFWFFFRGRCLELAAISKKLVGWQ